MNIIKKKHPVILISNLYKFRNTKQTPEELVFIKHHSGYGVSMVGHNKSAGSGLQSFILMPHRDKWETRK